MRNRRLMLRKGLFLVAEDVEAPSVPANLAAVAVSDTEIDLTWDASTDNVGVDHYNIYRDDVLVDTSVTNSFSDTGLTTLTEYTYEVSAEDAASNESARSAPAVETTLGLVLIDRTAGTNIGDMTANGGLTAAFDGTTAQAQLDCAAEGTSTGTSYVGKTLASAKVFGRAVVHGSNSSGFIGGSNPSVTLNVRGKDGAAPATSADGTLLGTVTFTDTADESAGRVINSTDLVNTWDHLWVELSVSGSVARFVAELVLYEWA